MADASDDRRIGSVIAGYRIDSRIGRGGMGVVYRAHHLSLERVAALKVIQPDSRCPCGVIRVKDSSSA